MDANTSTSGDMPNQVAPQQKGPKDPPHIQLDAAMTKNVAPANAAALLTTTVAGFGMTVAGDIFGPTLPVFALVVMAFAWVLAIVVALALVGRGPDPVTGKNDIATTPGSAAIPKRSRSLSDHLDCVKRGVSRARKNWKYATALMLMSFCAAYSAAAINKQRVEGKETNENVKLIRKDLASVEMELLKMGYGMSDEHAWRALADGNIEAMNLMKSANRTRFPVTTAGSVSALEGLILKPEADITAALDIAKLQPKDLDLPRHVESSYNGEFKIPQKTAMYESMGFTVARVIPTAAQRGSATYLNPDENKPWMAEVPPLLLAAWAKNENAVEALLKHGAKADAVTVLTVHTVGATKADTVLIYDIKVSALSEARRLGLQRAEAALVAAGATAVSKFEVVR